MVFLLFAIFLLLACAAVGFAVWPLLRGPAMRGRALLIGAITALVLGLVLAHMFCWVRPRLLCEA